MTSMCVYALMKRNVEELEPCNHITMHGIGLLDSFEQKTTPIFPAYYGSEYEYNTQSTNQIRRIERGVASYPSS